MPDSADFAELLTRVRSGDSEAAAELLRRYEAPLRRVIRLRLGGGRARGPVTESDVCQSVLGSLFVRMAAGEYELGTEADLQKLISRMAQNKLADLARRNTAARRDTRRATDADPDDQAAESRVGSPVRAVMGRELLAEVRRRLNSKELKLFDRRAEGRDWAEIAAELGEDEPALRQRLARAVRRVKTDLGLA